MLKQRSSTLMLILLGKEIFRLWLMEKHPENRTFRLVSTGENDNNFLTFSINFIILKLKMQYLINIVDDGGFLVIESNWFYPELNFFYVYQTKPQEVNSHLYYWEVARFIYSFICYDCLSDLDSSVVCSLKLLGYGFSFSKFDSLSSLTLTHLLNLGIFLSIHHLLLVYQYRLVLLFRQELKLILILFSKLVYQCK